MITEIFNLQNPWRSDASFSFHLKQRALLPTLSENLASKQILILVGSRQVGKSSLMYLIIESLIRERQVAATDMFYFNLDDLKLHELFESIPDFVHFVRARKSRKYVFIDEIQRLSNPGLLANQIGCLLNIENLSNAVRTSRSQVERYLTLLENTFIIRRIYPFFENYKKEITKTPKIYFMDLGLRNFALNNFSPLDSRTDVGKLFENFYLLQLVHQDVFGLQKINYWRTTNQTEIDFIVMRDNRREAIEVKWGKPTPPKSFKSIKKYYPDMQTTVISKAQFAKEHVFRSG